LFAGPIILLAALIVAALAMLVLVVSSPTRNVPFILATIAGLSLPPILFAVSWWLERTRFERTVADLEAYFELKPKGGDRGEIVGLAARQI